MIGPESTKFINSSGEIKNYYFKNNPWKLSKDNREQKIYRYCVICGENRFTDEVWKKKIEMWGNPPAICKKAACWKDLAYTWNFVPESFFHVKYGAVDYEKAMCEESFENVNKVTTHIRFDKVFANESEMPKEYVDTFKKLEEYPVEFRIIEIDALYYDHVEKNKIELDTTKMISETADPFLNALGDYRIKCVKIMQELKLDSKE